jgi:hypothetical protein
MPTQQKLFLGEKNEGLCQKPFLPRAEDDLLVKYWLFLCSYQMVELGISLVFIR